MDILTQEIFGPVVVCIPFDTEEEAITLAHDTTPGSGRILLHTRIWSRCGEWLGDWRWAWWWVNGAQLSCPQVAFGGIKQSGFGRRGSSLRHS
ncbi:4-trimethylaminobutyraldehyde dehydrogenase-like [Homalodisca vitripennis]|uniref:4-trimethylaminobutyraldehyde dehydrogenase-like n=1 Tax=Homalodisca vitripennis TaxID=197043 RepID=UPI001EE9B4B9|nr:4-trimethylaminobutyraldehyde dehydrogenase-like [Homalodisca vitripennis]